MTVTPKLQKILYGVFVTSSITIGSVLWYNRTGPDASRVKIQDWIDIRQSLYEKCLQTREHNNPQSITNSIVYTNYIADWIAGTNEYTTYTTGGVAVVTNYWEFNKYVDQAVYTNESAGDYRIDMISNFEEMYGSYDDKYIWNSYQSVFVSNFPAVPAIEGFYLSATNGKISEIQSWVDATIGFALPLRTVSDADQDSQTTVYTNVNEYWLFDFGPIGGIDVNAKSTLVGHPIGILFIEDMWTWRGDSIFNGWWYTVPGSPTLQTNATIVGSDYMTSLRREAPINWWIDRGPDTTYDRTDFQGINPEVHKAQFDDLDDKILDSTPFTGSAKTLVDAFHQVPNGGADKAEDGSRYITTNEATDGEYQGFTNIQQFYDLSTNITRVSVTVAAGVESVHTNSNPPSTNDLAYYGKVLQQFKWTRNGRSYSSSGSVQPYDRKNWWAPGYIDDSATSFTNVMQGYGASVVSWVNAQSIALTNLFSFDTSSEDLNGKPYAVTFGSYVSNAGVETWVAQINFSLAHLAYVGAYTQILHAAEFYAFGASPNEDDVPLEITETATDYSTFDDFGSGLVFGQYQRIATTAYDIVATPFCTNFAFTNSFTFPADPRPGAPVTNQLYKQYRGWRLDGKDAGDHPEIVMKWQDAYNTNSIP